MEARELLTIARRAQGLTQEAAARRAGTSQPTLSAYERGTKAPTLPVVERILRALGYELELTPRITFREFSVPGQGRTFHVPKRLWRLEPTECFRALPKGYMGARPHPMEPRQHRIVGYIWLLEHGTPQILFRHLDGALLVDHWPQMVPHMHREVTAQWFHLISRGKDAWWIDELGAALEARNQRPSTPVTPSARKRAVRRMEAYGLSRDEILKVIRRRFKPS